MLLMVPLCHMLQLYGLSGKQTLSRRNVLAVGTLLSPMIAAADDNDGASAKLYADRPPLPTPLAVNGRKDRELAIALVLPLVVYKAAANAMGNKLQWYLDAAIVLALSALVVYLQ